MTAATRPGLEAELRDCELTARAEGLAAGLTRALAGVDPTSVAPGRWVAVPARPAVDAGPGPLRHRLAEPEGIVFVECAGRRPTATSDLADAARRLAAVRLGLVRRTLDLAVEHLSERRSGGEPLLNKQMLTGDIADILGELELLRLYARSQREPSALADLHRRLDELGWQVSRLFGAIGYLADHPVRALYVAVLVANTYVGQAAR